MTGVALAATLFLGFESLSLLFTDDPAVLDIVQSGVWVMRIMRSKHFVSQVMRNDFILTNDELSQFVTISQPINAIAFVADGLYYGVSDFAYAAYSTVEISTPTLSHYSVIGYSCSFVILAILIYSAFQVFAGAVSSAFLLVVAPKFGLGGVWAGLTLFMSLRAIAGFWR